MLLLLEYSVDCSLPAPLPPPAGKVRWLSTCSANVKFSKARTGSVGLLVLSTCNAAQLKKGADVDSSQNSRALTSTWQTTMLPIMLLGYVNSGGSCSAIEACSCRIGVTHVQCPVSKVPYGVRSSGRSSQGPRLKLGTRVRVAQRDARASRVLGR